MGLHAYSAGPKIVCLADSLLAADTASFDIQNIPDDYGILFITAHLRSTQAVTAAAFTLKFNNDGGANYDYQYIQVNNSAVTGGIGSAGTSIPQSLLGPGSSAGASYMGANQVVIPNYTSSVYKALTTHAYTHHTGASDAFTRTGGAQWRSTSAIDRITITAASGNILAGSRLTIMAMPVS